MKAANKTKHIVHLVLRVSARFMYFDSSSNVCYSFTITPCVNESCVSVSVSLMYVPFIFFFVLKAARLKLRNATEMFHAASP